MFQAIAMNCGCSLFVCLRMLTGNELDELICLGGDFSWHKVPKWEPEARRNFHFFPILYEYVITPADIFARHICSPVFFLFDIYLLSSFTEQANPLIQCWLNRESRPLHRRFLRITYLEQDLILHTHCVRETSLVEPTMWK